MSERLIDLGATETEARCYEDYVRRGQILITVVGMRRGAEAASILARHGSILGAGTVELAGGMASGGDAPVVQEDVRPPSLDLTHTG